MAGVCPGHFDSWGTALPLELGYRITALRAGPEMAA